MKAWFKAALTEKSCFDQAGSLVYFHGQLIQLIQAGYLIVKNNLAYQREQDHLAHAATSGSWVNKIKLEQDEEGRGFISDYNTCALTKSERSKPFQYLRKHLKLEKIKHIRYGLHEWLYVV